MAQKFSQESVLDFLCKSGGKVRNTDLLRHYQTFLKDPKRQVQYREQFKKFVNSLAVVREEDGVKYVVLRKRYRELVGEDCGRPEEEPPFPSPVLVGDGNGHSTHFSGEPASAVAPHAPPVEGGGWNAAGPFYTEARRWRNGTDQCFGSVYSGAEVTAAAGLCTNGPRGVPGGGTRGLPGVAIMPAFTELRTSAAGGGVAATNFARSRPDSDGEKCGRIAAVSSCGLPVRSLHSPYKGCSGQQRVGVQPAPAPQLGPARPAGDTFGERWNEQLRQGRVRDRLPTQPEAEARGGAWDSSYPNHVSFWNGDQTQNDNTWSVSSSLVEPPSSLSTTSLSQSSWLSLDSLLRQTEIPPRYVARPSSESAARSGGGGGAWPLSVAHDHELLGSQLCPQDLPTFLDAREPGLDSGKRTTTHGRRPAEYAENLYHRQPNHTGRKVVEEPFEHSLQTVSISSFAPRERVGTGRAHPQVLEAERASDSSSAVSRAGHAAHVKDWELVAQRTPFSRGEDNALASGIVENNRWPSSDFQLMLDNAKNNISVHAKKAQITKSLSSSLPEINKHISSKSPKYSSPDVSSITTHDNLRNVNLSKREGSSQKLELVPLDPKEHDWIVKLATGSLNQAYGLLLEDPNLATKRDFISGYTALHWIAKHGDMNSLYMFFNGATKAGVMLNVNVKSGCGYTPLHIAAIHGHHKVIKLLVRKFKANVTIRDSSGKKPWQYLSSKAPGESWQLLGAPKAHTTVAAQNSPNRNTLHSTEKNILASPRHVSRKISLAALLKQQHLKWKTAKSEYLPTVRDTDDDSD